MYDHFMVNPAIKDPLSKIRTDVQTRPIIAPYKSTAIWVTEEIPSYMHDFIARAPLATTTNRLRLQREILANQDF